MGWKSTITLTRKEAIEVIRSCDKDLDSMSNDELDARMQELSIGDDLHKPYFGYNFNIVDTQEEKDKSIF